MTSIRICLFKLGVPKETCNRVIKPIELDQIPGYLLHIGDCTTQLCRDYDKQL